MSKRTNRERLYRTLERYSAVCFRGQTLVCEQTCKAPHVLHEELLYHDEPEPLAEDEVHLSCQSGETAPQ